MSSRLAVAILLAGGTAVVLGASPPTTPDERAAATVARMSPEELGTLVHGPMAMALFGMSVPEGAVPGAGYIPGIPRLAVPALTESDASLGVAYLMGIRKDGATALPSGSALASTWDPAVLREGGALIGSEAHAKGFNVLLAGGVNLVREPRNGRTFEYLGEDPWLAGTLDGASIAGIQSVHVISTLKHYALNGQETGRQFIDSRISEAAARESDLLAFQIALERGQPGSVMCSYNQINGAWGCDNDWLLNRVLKGDWGYKGFVMSDWGAVHGLEYALHGLDQQSGEQLDKQVYFGAPLREAAAREPRYAERLKDMNKRILRSMYAVGLDTNPPVIKPIDLQANAAVAEKAALEGIVLLRNQGALPLDAGSLKRIAIIGGYADTGVLSGGGSSQTHGLGGPALARPRGGEGPLAAFLSEQYHRSNPLRAIQAQAPGAEIFFRDGRHVADAVAAARKSDVVVVFATQGMTEGLDEPDLSLPDGQDQVIAAVAAANPRTIVVLETGGAVLMPWLEHTAAVVEAWYPGARGGEAIAALLFGKANFSGRLPLTFPASEAQLPHPTLVGSDTIEPDFMGNGHAGQSLSVDYDVEGSDVGYRWFARRGERPLFPFGFGLSYTTFETAGLAVQAGKQGVVASASVRNTGARAGAEVVQVYLTSAAGQATRRLVGYQRIALDAGASGNVQLSVDPRLLARWEGDGWHQPAGSYRFALGRNAMDLGAEVDVRLPEKRWQDVGRATARRKGH
jgi:beta-glucosidase